ncbi:unnamed protein product [Fraxinus pennsylvanica]|uniref:Uncharacterized protein n=1 Tax=Fraxinus pennsylvanica TaxID=56036 RepID=A0AAD1Z102_9LAMI|nr:unnamed protein product [Fraxinus pennsylvanica]
MDRRKWMKGSTKYVGTTIVSYSSGFSGEEDEVDASDDNADIESIMELEMVGEGKKKHWEVKVVAKSTVLVVSIPDSKLDKEWWFDVVEEATEVVTAAEQSIVKS